MGDLQLHWVSLDASMEEDGAGRCLVICNHFRTSDHAYHGGSDECGDDDDGSCTRDDDEGADGQGE